MKSSQVELLVFNQLMLEKIGRSLRVHPSHPASLPHTQNGEKIAGQRPAAATTQILRSTFGLYTPCSLAQLARPVFGLSRSQKKNCIAEQHCGITEQYTEHKKHRGGITVASRAHMHVQAEVAEGTQAAFKAVGRIQSNIMATAQQVSPLSSCMCRWLGRLRRIGGMGSSTDRSYSAC